MIAALAGILVALVTILGIKFRGTENKPWTYPLILSSFPMFYFAFSIYAGDMDVLTREIVFAIPIFVICILSAVKNLRFSGVLLGLGYLGHGVYDGLHESIFHNPGMPSWWPVFCGVIDVLVGIYILYFVRKLPKLSIVHG